MPIQKTKNENSMSNRQLDGYNGKNKAKAQNPPQNRQDSCGALLFPHKDGNPSTELSSNNL